MSKKEEKLEVNLNSDLFDQSLGNKEEIIVKAEMVTGHLEFFCAEDNVNDYLDLFDSFVAINNVKEEDQMKWLLGYCGKILFPKIKTICAPKEPKDSKYSEIRSKLVALLTPKKNTAVCRAQFYARIQKAGESAQEFALQLKELASGCDFDTHLDFAMRDRFIYNLADANAKTKVMEQEFSSFDDAVKYTATYELSHKVELDLNRVAPRYRLGPPVNSRQIRQGSQNYRQQFGDQRRGRISKNQGSKMCPTCGNDDHQGNKCPAVKRMYTCNYCGKRGHTIKVCWKRLNDVGISESEQEDESLGDLAAANNLQSINDSDIDILEINVSNEGKSNNFISKIEAKPPFLVSLLIDGKLISWEVDTGACVSVISKQQANELFKERKIKELKGRNFYNADGRKCNVTGYVNLRVNEGHELSALVLDCERRNFPLLGRDWLEVLFPKWRQVFGSGLKIGTTGNDKCINSVKTQRLVEKIREDFADVFEENSSPIKGFKAKIDVIPESNPVFRKSAVPPYALREKIAKQIRSLEEKGIIEYVEHSDWASQLVVAPKKSGDLRLCGNYKPTLNPHIHDNRYPLPLIEDLLNEMGGNKVYASIDLTGAYLQLELEEASKDFTTINTPLGLYRYNRLPFGIKTAPAIFQSIIDKILNGLPGVVSYFDDILVAGTSLEECVKRVRMVLEKLRQFNVKANFQKCKFFEEILEYLGHEISMKGIKPTKSKIETILNIPAPTDITSVRSLLGLVNFYNKFVPNMQTLLNPIHELLRNGVKFEWSVKCQKAFEKVKAILANGPMLTHFDPKYPIVLTCDASPYGIGAVLSLVKNGVEIPVQMMSATLSTAEKNYAQIHREALAIVSSVKKFHKYVYGYPVTVYTDCRALESILSKSKPMNTVINSRFLRWILFLQNYNLSIKFKSSKFITNADALSRLPVSDGTGIPAEELSLLNLNSFNEIHENVISREEIAKEMKEFSVFQKLSEFIRKGWPNKDKIYPQLREFYRFRESLEEQNGCVFYGDRIFIPLRLRPTILQKLHKEHQGMVRAKQIARSTFWWPKIDQDIEELVRNCDICQTYGAHRKQSPLSSWPCTTFPMERLHMDHFFFKNKTFLILVDDFSNWIEISPQSCVDTENVLTSLRKFCSIFGLPETLVTDNGGAFISKEFNNFCKANSMVHVTTPPYHPQSNGLAERGVGIVKENLEKFLNDPNKKAVSLEKQIQNFLFTTHNTPTKFGTPCQRIFNYKPRTNWFTLQKDNGCGKNSTTPRTTKNQAEKVGKSSAVTRSNEKIVKNGKSNELNRRNFELMPLQQVYAKLACKNEWLKGKILKKISPYVYWVQLKSGHELKVHRDSLKVRNSLPNQLILQQNHNFHVKNPSPKQTQRRLSNTEGQSRTPPLAQEPAPQQTPTTNSDIKERLRTKPSINYRRFFK